MSYRSLATLPFRSLAGEVNNNDFPASQNNQLVSIGVDQKIMGIAISAKVVRFSNTSVSIDCKQFVVMVLGIQEARRLIKPECPWISTAIHFNDMFT